MASAPLAWDEGLARDAAVYAQRLARTGRFEHDPQAAGRPRQGENLFMGTRGAYSYGDMIGLLVDERRYFRPGRFPDVSRTGDWSHVGHYTQIIWPTSQRVGCATASNRANDYLVCRYLPAGNVVGTMLALIFNQAIPAGLLTSAGAQSRPMKRVIALALLRCGSGRGRDAAQPQLAGAGGPRRGAAAQHGARRSQPGARRVRRAAGGVER